MSYWDTSCLVKLYTPEPDSLLLRNHLRQSIRCVTAEVALLEFWATVRRKESEGILGIGEAAKVQSAFEGDVSAGLIEVVQSELWEPGTMCRGPDSRRPPGSACVPAGSGG